MIFDVACILEIILILECRFCIGNIKNFCDALSGDKCVFQIDAILHMRKISLKPACNDLINIIVDIVNDFIEK